MRTVVFLHGLLVDHRLWRKVVPALGDGIEAIVPTLPLGAHEQAAPAGADLTPPGLARCSSPPACRAGSRRSPRASRCRPCAGLPIA